MSGVRIIAARRSAVVPVNNAFARIEADELAAAIIIALIEDCGIDPGAVDEVILGNALYGGGNPARVASLRAGLPESVAAMSLDTQCCAGLDAIALGAARIKAGQAKVVIAGGVESFSRAPLRAVRPRGPHESPQFYDRPPFTPWPDRDPDMIAAAADLAARENISRADQEAFAINSHRKARAARARRGDEIVPIGDTGHDLFTRDLSEQLCARLPVIAGQGDCALTAATIAIEADAAAALVLVADDDERAAAHRGPAIGLVGSAARGADPTLPGLAPITAARALLDQLGWRAEDIGVAEVMEAFAAQAIACIDTIGLGPERVNRGGGALARGHPIGASGAILIVRLWHELARERARARGLALIAAAGGLGSAMALERL